MYEEPRDMKQAEMIVISLDSIDQLIEPCPPSPFRKRQLREEAERFLVEHVTALPRQAPAKLLISLPHSEANDERKVVDAIHADFNFRRIEAEKHLAQTRRFGWRSLVIAL